MISKFLHCFCIYFKEIFAKLENLGIFPIVFVFILIGKGFWAEKLHCFIRDFVSSDNLHCFFRDFVCFASHMSHKITIPSVRESLDFFTGPPELFVLQYTRVKILLFLYSFH